MVDYDEELALEPPRKWPEWPEARGREEDAWRLEPEGETEAPSWTLIVNATMKSKWRAKRGG